MIKEKQLGLLIGIIFLSLFLFLGNSYFYTKGEPREAVVALSMLKQNNWILPINNGVDMAYKPPLFHWCITLGALLTGRVSEYISRFPSAIALSIMVLVGYIFFSKRSERKKAFVMALLTLTNFELHRAGTNCRVDMLLSAFIVLALYQLYQWNEKGLRGIPWVGILCLSGAFLTKGPVGIILPCLVMSVFLWIRGMRLGYVLFIFSWIGLIACILPLAWYYSAYRQGGDRFLQLVMEENIWRFMGKMSYESHENPAYYNILTVIAGFMPYTIFILISIFTSQNFRKKRIVHCKWWIHIKQYIRNMDDIRLFSLLSIAIIFVFYCIPKSKRSVYLIPIYPFIAYFLAEYMFYLWHIRPKTVKIFGYIISGLSLMVLVLFASIRFGWIPESFFTGQHAAENIVFMNALKATPLGLLGYLSVGGIFVTTGWYFFNCRKKNSYYGVFYGIFAVIFSLYFALDGFFIPTVLNVKSDKPVASHIATLVPDGKLYSCYPNQMTGNPMRQFSLNFYLNDRIVPFELEKPSEGYLIAGEEDAKEFKKKHTHYQLELIYDSGHSSCDDHKIIHLYHFEETPE